MTAPLREETEDLWVFNGVDATTGGYLVPPLTPDEVLDVLRDLPDGPEPRGVVHGFDDPAVAVRGWGMICPPDLDPAIREALQLLLDHRRGQAASIRECRFRGDLELRPGEPLDDFLGRHGRGVGPVHPDKLPYYLLLVGEPTDVPFGFQTGLDVQHAVGRLCFDTPEEYARYAEAVVQAERGEGSRSRDRLIDLFAPRNPDDRSTELSADRLITPLAEVLKNGLPDWRVRLTAGDRATKRALEEILCSKDGRPSLLFTASHGLGLSCGHPDQRERQGALLCQDWPGPEEHHGPIPPEWSFAAADLDRLDRLDRLDVAGLVAFCFGCHGAGTPQLDDFAHRNRWQSKQIAPQDFVARLPQRLLERGALAVIGHLDRAWAYSFLWRDVGQIDVFESTLRRLLDGWPVGAAMEDFNQRYSELATRLTHILDRSPSGKPLNAKEVSRLWTAHNDARGYVVVGDPAVRVRPSPPAPLPQAGEGCGLEGFRGFPTPLSRSRERGRG